MEFFYFLFCLTLTILLLILFLLLSSSEKHEKYLSTVFECGFTSYFFSRFSFSIQFFLVALIFLFFDLELCCLMPLFQEAGSDNKTIQMIFLFVSVLLIGLFKEVKDSKLDWVS